MTDLRTAAQQALEFCEFLWRDVPLNDYSEDMRQDVESALRAALAEPDVPETNFGNMEPVAWRYSVQPQVLGASYWAFSETKDVPDAQPLYAAPPQRNPLTGQEYADVYEQCADWDDFARAVGRAHGIK